MKKKLRKIIIQEKTYLYSLKESLCKKQVGGNLYWKNTLRIYVENYRQTPLVVYFFAKDDYYMGNMLTKEIVDGLNIHYPSVIQKIINYALTQENWQANNSGLTLHNGLSILQKLGYDISSINPQTETIHEFLLEEE